MRLEVSDGHLRSVLPMTAWWDKFHIHAVLVTDDFCHGLGYFVDQDMLIGYNARSFQATHHGSVGSC